jgi:predicted heme/steroid binding protein
VVKDYTLEELAHYNGVDVASILVGMDMLVK